MTGTRKNNTIMRNRLMILAGIVGLMLGNEAMAQDFDDIYYDSSRSSKKEKKQEQEWREPDAEAAGDASSLVFTGENYEEERDVDEYNRRGSYVADGDRTAMAADST